MNNKLNATENEPELPILTTKRIRLRLPQTSDVKDIFKVFSSADAMRYWSRAPYENEQEALDLINDIHQHCSNKTLYQWGIEWRANQHIIGTCTLARLDWDNGRCELGFILHPDYWRQGVAGEGLSALFQHAFYDMGMRRIEADVDPNNVASVSTLESMGFQREGLLRERWNLGDDVQDSYFYGLLKRDWEQHPKYKEP